MEGECVTTAPPLPHVYSVLQYVTSNSVCGFINAIAGKQRHFLSQGPLLSGGKTYFM